MTVTGADNQKGTDMDEQQVILTDDELWGAPAPTSEEHTPGSSRRKWIAAVLGAAAIGAAAVVGANVASSSTKSLGVAGPGGGGGPGGFGGPGGPGGRGGIGTIASIDGSTIKMTTEDGTTVSVVTSASTTVTASSAGTLADVKVGDNVRITGTTADNTVAATSITDGGTTPLADLPGGPGRGGPPAGGFQGGPPQGSSGGQPAPPSQRGAAGQQQGTPPQGAGANGGANFGNRPNGGPATTGTVKTVNGGTLTVATADGTTVTVTTSSATTVTLVKPSSVQALKVGDQIQVNGATATNGTITADSIRSGVVAGGR